jgi:copper chaperone CopZ
MKNIVTLATLVAFGGFAQAQDAPKPDAKKGKCATACATGCNADVGGTMVKLAVTGLEKEGVGATTEVKLGAMAGINKCGTCSKSNTVMVKYDPEVMTVAAIEKAVAANGLKVKGHMTAMKVKGLACQSCSNHLTTVLGKTEGIVNVDKVCHQSGNVMVTYDPKKTDMKKIKAAVNTTKYKVIDEKAKDCKSCEKAPVIQS